MKYTFLFNEIFRTTLVECVQVRLTLVELMKVCPALVERVHVYTKSMRSMDLVYTALIELVKSFSNGSEFLDKLLRDW